MRAPAKKAILNVIIAASIGAILLICVLILAQIREQNEAIQEQQDLIIEQTDINQRFIRCLILIPGDRDRTPEERIEAIDRCAIESRLPSGEPTSPSPTNQDREDFENQQEPEGQPVPKAQPPAQGATMNPSKPNPPSPEPPEEPQEERPVRDTVERIIDTVKDLL